MKKIYALSLFSFIIAIAVAQIPNSSFENWSSSAPTGWSGSTDITQTTPGHSGTYAAKGEKTASTYPNLSLVNASISQAYDYLNFYYKFNSVSADYIFVNVEVKNGSNAVIGTGFAMITASSASYQLNSVLINYSGSGAATVSIQVTMNAGGGAPVPHVGSYFIVDDFVLSNNTGITQALRPEFTLGPNPTANLLNLQLERPAAATVVLTNVLGQEVKNLSITQQQYQLDVSDLTNGIYIVTIKQEGILSTRKIQVAR